MTPSDQSVGGAQTTSAAGAPTDEDETAKVTSGSGEATGPGYRDIPYFGLDYYDEGHGDWFFGREDDCDNLITNLLGSRLTLLHAESGVGKSSLLRAGVARQLRQAATAERPGDATAYVPVVFSDWKDEPVAELVKAIGKAIKPLLGDGDGVELPAESLGAAIKKAAEAVNATLLVILDQFEDYFLYAPAEQPEPGRFADELGRCVNRLDLSVSFLISIREEAYAGLGDIFKGRIANVYGNYLHVDYLDRAAAEDAIRKPLAVYNQQPGIPWRVDIEDELVEAVLDQVRLPGHDADAATDGGSGVKEGGDGRVVTTLLQLVMETVWNRERDNKSRVLQASTLRDLEGAEKIVDTHLKRALDDLSDEHRVIAIDALDHLVTPDGGKIAASISQLAQRDNHSEDDLAEVFKTLDGKRIVRWVPPPAGKDSSQSPRYEIFHDVLGPAINRAVAVEDQRRDQERRAIEARAKRAGRRARVSLRFAGGMLLALVVALALVVETLHQREQAVDNKKFAQSLELASFSQQTLSQSPSLSTLLALRALKIRYSPQAALALRSTMFARGPVLRANSGAVSTAFFSPDGKLIITASAGGTVGIWNVAQKTSAATIEIRRAQLNSAEIDPSGKLFVTADADGTASVWSFAVGSEVAVGPVGPPLRAGHGAVTSALFSPDGKLIVTANSDGTVRIWSVATSREVASMTAPNGGNLNSATGGSTNGANRGSVSSAMVSPNGALIVAAGSNGTADVWLVASHELAGRFRTGDTAPLNGAAFSPDGSRIVVASSDGSAWIWDVATGRLLRELRAGTGTVYSASYDPTGRLIVTTSADGTARIWSALTGAQLAIFKGSFANAAFSPDGRTLVTAGFDGTARLPATEVPNLIGPLPSLERIARAQLHGESLTPQQQATYLVGIGS